jgi:hypothetical protein
MSPAVYRLGHQLLALSGLRLALASVGFAASVAAGATARSAGLGVGFGLAASAVGLLTNRRSPLLRRLTVEPLPEQARRTPLAHAVARGLLPSTAGVTLLLVISLAFEPIMAAVLAGILGGMSAVGLLSWLQVTLWERRRGARLLTDATDSSRRYVAPL